MNQHINHDLPEPNEDGVRIQHFETALFSLGSGHKHRLVDESEGFDVTFTPDALIFIRAPNPRAVMFAVFGRAWSHPYDPAVVTQDELDRYWPRGIVDITGKPVTLADAKQMRAGDRSER